MNRELKKYLDTNTALIKNSKKSFADIYEIMFRCKDYILAETNDGFRIKKYTYGEVYRSINAVSAAIYDKIGATHGFVALEMDNCIEWIIAFWALLRSGNKPLLINLRHPKSLSDGIIKKLGVKYVIGMSSSELDAEFINFSDLSSNCEFRGEFENEIALSTSATSLNETVCVYTGKEISEQILCTEDILKKSSRISGHYKGSLKNLAFLPFYHIFGLVAVYFWFTFFGRTLVFLKDYSPDTILKTCRKHEVTHIFAVPMLWHTIEKQLLKTVKNSDDKTQKKFYRGLKVSRFIQTFFPQSGPAVAQKLMHDITDRLFGQSVKFCISGGSYIKDSALSLINDIGYPLHNGYGMSEIGITSVELGKTLKARKNGSVGRPFSSVNYRISERGTLLLKADSAAARLITGECETVREEWLDTGDIMQCRGGDYFILGRESDTVIGENGENINPDITEQLFDIPDATAFSVLGLLSGDCERPSLVIQINRYLPKQRISDIIDSVYKINSSLPAASAVKDFYFTFDPIMNPNAVKVSRKWLVRAIDTGDVKLLPFADIKSSLSDTPDGFDGNSPLAKRVKQIVADELGVNADSIDDNAHIIFDLGADSLKYFSVLTALAKEFSVTDYSDKENYRYTVKEFCEYLERYI